MSGQDWEQLTLFPADSPASRFPSPGSGEAVRMTVTSGRKCLELYRRSGPVGSLVRMLLGSSIWRSTRCMLTWKESATPSKRLLFRLSPSTPRTAATDAPLLPKITTFDAFCGDLAGKEYTGTRHAMKLIQAAKIWPTPRANDGEKRGNISGDPRNGLPGAVLWATPTASQCGMTARTGGRPLEKSTKLGTQVAIAEGLLPTPIATDWKNRGCKDYRRNREYQLQTAVGGTLNPDWVEWLMGFSPGWTEA